jgi:hypothetical protein
MMPSPISHRVLAAVIDLAVGTAAAQSLVAHPDYLSYFNEIPQHKNYTLAESDLDWGQDLQRLSLKLKELRTASGLGGHDCYFSQNRYTACDPIYLNYFGSADLSQFDLPPHQMLQGWQPVKGWIAVSIHVETIEAAALAQSWVPSFGDYFEHMPPLPGPLDWLTKHYQPVAMAGKSIKIYHVE